MTNKRQFLAQEKKKEWEKIIANKTQQTNFNNIQAAHTTQYQKNKNPVKIGWKT